MAHGSITITDDPDHPGHFRFDRFLSGDAVDENSVSHGMIIVLEDAVMAAIEAMQRATEQADAPRILVPNQGVIHGV